MVLFLKLFGHSLIHSPHFISISGQNINSTHSQSVLNSFAGYWKQNSPYLCAEYISHQSNVAVPCHTPRTSGILFHFFNFAQILNLGSYHHGPNLGTGNMVLLLERV